MRRGIAMFVTCISVLSLVAAPAVAQDKKEKDKKKPDATIELSSGQVAAGVGYTWGGGTLQYQGKKYPVKVEGLSVGEVGITKATAKGEVFNLKKLEDFNGNYNAAEAGATVAGGAGITAMKNQNGVVVQLKSTTKGANVKLAVSGVSLSLK